MHASHIRKHVHSHMNLDLPRPTLVHDRLTSAMAAFYLRYLVLDSGTHTCAGLNKRAACDASIRSFPHRSHE